MRPTVVLLHGLGRSARSLRRLGCALEADGYPIWNRSYPSRRQPIPQLADTLTGWLQADLGDRPVVAVTHSMGGIIARHIGDRMNWQAQVMLAPPNAGSAVAEKIRRYRLFKLIFGPALQDVAQGETWPDPPAPCGIISGTKGASWDNPSSWLIKLLGLLPPEPHDGTVTVAETRGTQFVDHVELKVSHTWIMNHPQTVRWVKAFLADGRFGAPR